MKRIFVIGYVVWLEMLRRKDIYVFFMLLAAGLAAMLSTDAFGAGGASGHVKETGLLLTWLFSIVIAVHVAARQIPREENTGTVYPLLAKPVSRLEFVLGKWFGAWSIVSAATIAYYLFTAAVAGLRGGGLDAAALAQAALLHSMALAVIAAMAVAFSTRMTAEAAAVMTYIFSLGAYAITGHIPSLIAQEQGLRGNALLALYYFLPHLELFDMRRRLVHDWGAAPAWAICSVVVYGALLTAACLAAAWLVYGAKRFTRGAQI